MGVGEIGERIRQARQRRGWQRKQKQHQNLIIEDMEVDGCGEGGATQVLERHTTRIQLQITPAFGFEHPRRKHDSVVGEIKRLNE